MAKTVAEILAGDRFSKLTVIGKSIRQRYIVCVCVCGKTKEIRGDHLISGATVSCGCQRKSNPGPPRIQDPEVGDKFGRLTVTSAIVRGVDVYCVCDCGTKTVARKDHLLSGATKSCGCGRLSQNGLSRSCQKELSAWHGIISRCLNPNTSNYHRYGGRGIKVCDAWQGVDGFRNFLSDVGKAPNELSTIERTNNDGNYEPSNVIWSSRTGQARNRCSNRVILAFGKTQTLQEWSNETGIKRETIAYRINTGWSVDDALSTRVKMKSIEVCVIVCVDGAPIYWRTGNNSNIEDSVSMWNVIWQLRNDISCIAHSHPGSGHWPSPSHEDVTTFSAIELGLGRRLTWWIANESSLVFLTWAGPEKYDYRIENVQAEFEPPWVKELREKSKGEGI